MRVSNQITFTAKDDAEALRLASEKLGRDAVILSTQIVKEGGVFGLFKRSVLKVTAGILEDAPSSPNPKAPVRNASGSMSSMSSIASMDEETRRENLVAFQKLMELKEKSDFENSIIVAPEPAKEIKIGEEGYRLPVTENVKISTEGLRNAYGLSNASSSASSSKLEPEAASLENEYSKLAGRVGVLNGRIESLLQRISSPFTSLQFIFSPPRGW